MEVYQHRRYYNRWNFKTDDIITGGSSSKHDIITGGNLFRGKFIKTDDIITGGSSSKQTIL